MTSNSPINLPGYESAIKLAAFYPQRTAGYIRIRGEDRQAFVQRQSTNDIQSLTPERCVTTVLTSATARILDVLTLVQEPQALGAITLPGRAQHTARFLNSKIFFNDDISVEDASQEFAQFDLIGPKSATLFQRVGIDPIPRSEELVSGQVSGIDFKILSQHDSGYRLLIPAGERENIAGIFNEAGIDELTTEAYAVLRVEMGLPEADHELTEDYTPLETGLNWAISGDKGCYTGQEVIARQITYDKITRQMVGLNLKGEAEPGAGVLSIEANRNVGEITSYAHSPRFGHIALAVIRKPHYKPGTEVLITDKDEDIHAITTSLPFSN